MSAQPHIADVILERRQSALLVTLNRPQAKNALTAAMISGLISLTDWLEESQDIRCVVLRGAGGAFCAGGDVKEFGRQLMSADPDPDAPDPVAAGNRVFGDLLLKLDAVPQTLVCDVEGPAFGGAMGFLSVADVVIAAQSAQFSLSETSLGIIPAQIAPFVVRRIGLFNARRLALTGARFGAAEALAVGLVDRIAPEGAGVSALVDVLNAIGRCEPRANAATKRLFNAAGSQVDPALLDAAAATFAACLRTRGREGAMAFAAKTQAPWVETYEDQVLS